MFSVQNVLCEFAHLKVSNLHNTVFLVDGMAVDSKVAFEYVEF